MDWKGFSSEEIKRLQNNSKFTTLHDKELVGKNKTLNTDVKLKKVDLSQHAVASKSKLLRGTTADTKCEAVPQYQVSSDALLSIKKEIPMERNIIDKVRGNDLVPNPKKPIVTIVVCEDKSYEVLPSESDDKGDSGVSSGLSSLDSCNSVISNQNGQLHTSIELFRERQKQMEELNKRRRELLSKAIADRKKQTQFEAKKLLEIQEELIRLDALLSTDVEILRNQIEIAASHFNDAQKRYDRAETEFIEAKLHLFSKLERKELLTEHLCRIIDVNELRKAKKLSELMAKLEITDVNTTFSCANDDGGVGLYSLENSSLDEVSYTVCTTLKDPNRISSKLISNDESSSSRTSSESLVNNSPPHIESLLQTTTTTTSSSSGRVQSLLQTTTTTTSNSSGRVQSPLQTTTSSSSSVPPPNLIQNSLAIEEEEIKPAKENNHQTSVL